jgi:hypothetical protein
MGSRCSEVGSVTSLSSGGSCMVTESGRGLRGPVWPSGSQPFMLKSHGLAIPQPMSYQNFLHLNFDTQDTLSQQDMPHSVVNEIKGRLARMDHESVSEFHGFGTGCTKFARNDDLATLCARLHHKSKDTIAGASSRITILQFSNCERTYRRTARPPRSLYLRLSHWAMAERPRCCTFSAYNSREFSGNLKRF